MKKIYFIALTLVAGISLNASAQKNIAGGIEASKVTMTRTGNSVLLEMVLDIKKDVITKCQSIAVTPALSYGAEHVAFQYVLVNGKNKSQMFDRKKKFGNTELMKNPPLEVVNIDKNNRGKKINYAAQVNYEPWMDNASLDIELILSSCANELQLYALEISAVTMAAAPVEIVEEVVGVPVIIEREKVAEVPKKEPVIVVEVPKTEPPVVIVPPKTEPVVAVEVPRTAPATVGTAQQVSGSAYLDFEPESSVIVPFYKRNPHELAKINDALDKIKNNPNAEVKQITIVGYASPEGRYSTNETLAYDRARSFARYIQDRYGIASRVSAVAEDWETLRALVVVSDIPYKSTILSIIDGTEAPDAKESKLRRLDNGRVWRIMTDEMFPMLRRVEYKIDYTVK